MKKFEDNTGVADYEKFLTTFFRDKPDDLHINIWTLKNRMTAWLKDIELAVNRVAQKTDEDVFFGIGLTEKAYGPRERGSKEKVVGIMGLHLDIDIKNPAHHKKQNLPETIDEGLSIVSGMDLTPSIVVNSGYGLHVYFLFKKPWIFSSDSDRQDAEILLRRCHETAKAIAAKEGWAIDSVFDLARVMRVPGTTNNKDPQNPVMAKIIETKDVRYDPDEIGQYFMQVEDVKPASKQKPEKNIINTDILNLSMDADPPAEKFDVLFENSPEFRAVWQKKRNNLPSASEYDWAIVRHCADVGWTDKEIINTCVAWRRRHDENPAKIIKRPDYVNGLILHAHKCREENSMDKLSGYGTLKDTPYCSQVDAKSLLADVSKRLKIQINSIERYNEEPPTFMLHTDRGEIPLGEIKNILQQSKFREKIAQYTNHIIPDIRPQRDNPDSGWQAIAQILLSASKNVELSPDQTRLGAIKADLREYLAVHHMAENLQDAVSSTQPVFHEGHLLIRLEHLGGWVRSGRRPDESDRSLARQLKWIGGEYTSYNIDIDGKRTTRGFWKIPEDITQEVAACFV